MASADSVAEFVVVVVAVAAVLVVVALVIYFDLTLSVAVTTMTAMTLATMVGVYFLARGCYVPVFLHVQPLLELIPFPASIVHYLVSPFFAKKKKIK